MLRQYKLKDYNFRLVLWVMSLSILGILMVGSAEASLQSRQMMGVIMGTILMLVISLFDYSWVLSFYWIIYGVNILMLSAVLLYGWATHGARRWINLGFTKFQPVELAKIFLILFFAMFLMKHANEISKPRTIIKAMLLIALPLALIIMEPDLKNTLTITMVFCCLYFVAGLDFRIVFGAVGAVILAAAILLPIILQPGSNILRDYQRDRIMMFIYQDDENYDYDNTQQNNSVTAIGSGQLTGKGLNNSDVSSANKGNFIPEIQTDFIFAVAGEELGFIGSAGIIILLLLIILECLFTGRRAKDLSGTIICTGMAALIAFQSFINIGVATGILPNTGTPLPFVSNGLSSLVSLYIGIGFVLNVSLQNKVRLSEVRHSERKAVRHRYVRRND